MTYTPINFIDQVDPLNGDPGAPRLNATNLSYIQQQYAESKADRIASGVLIAGVDFSLSGNISTILSEQITSLSEDDGGTIILPPGSYVLPEPILPELAYGVALIGTAPGITRGSADRRGTTLVCSGNFSAINGFWENSSLSHLRVDADNRGGKGIDVDISKSIIEWCEISNYVGYAMHLGNGSYEDSLQYLNHITNNTINALNGNGIGMMIEYRLIDCWVLNNNIGSIGPNLQTTAGTLRIIGNHFDGVEGGGPEYNIFIPGSNPDILISNNLLEHARKNAIYIERPPWESGNANVYYSMNNNIMRANSYGDSGEYSMVRVKGNTPDEGTATYTGINVTGNLMHPADSMSAKYMVEVERVNSIAITSNNWPGAYTGGDPVKFTNVNSFEVSGNAGLNDIAP